MDESPIIVGETEEHLDVLIKFGGWPLLNGFNAFEVHVNAINAYNKAEELKLFLEKMAFGLVSI